MQKAKAFFLVCAGLFLLALSYHLGARSATAQAGATGFGCAVVGSAQFVMTPSGDVYYREAQLGTMPVFNPSQPPTYVGNFWGGATPSTTQSWGKIKADYRK